jgi:hypothetical protein
MYVFPVGNQNWLYDRDEKRVGKYRDTEDISIKIVSRDVRHITITNNNLNQGKGKIIENNSDQNNQISEEWLGKNLNIKI